MKPIIMTINDTMWIITAILCVFVEHPAITAIVCATTVVYAIDLWFKFAAMEYKFAPFIKAYWLDILFLIPICKLFRGFRILKVGKLLRFVDATCDFTEIAFRVRNAVQSHRKPTVQQEYRNHWATGITGSLPGGAPSSHIRHIERRHTMQIIEAENSAFTKFSKEQLDTLEKAIQIVDPNAFVSKVDYAKGEIKVGIVHNKGTEHEFANDDLITVNVASDSAPAAFYDVYTSAYNRLI